MTAAYYNENDAYAAEWLRNLISAGLIAAGDVDLAGCFAVATEAMRERHKAGAPLPEFYVPSRERGPK